MYIYDCVVVVVPGTRYMLRYRERERVKREVGEMKHDLLFFTSVNDVIVGPRRPVSKEAMASEPNQEQGKARRHGKAIVNECSIVPFRDDYPFEILFVI